MNLSSVALSDLPVFFIVGRGRSGSTLLRSAFDAHPNITIPLESRFVQYLFYRYHRIKKWTPELALKAISDIDKSFEPLDLDHREIFKQVKLYHNNLSFQLVCKIIYISSSVSVNKKDIQCIGDKNPRYTFFIPRLIKIFPQARFIHLVRDYRANALAVTRAAKVIGEIKAIPVAVARWKYYNRIIDRLKNRFPERFYTLRYEDLVEDPEKCLRQLCEFVGVNFSKTMLNYEVNIDNYFFDNSFSRLHQSLKKPFDISKISEWQEKLSRYEIMLCEILAGDYGEKAGYKTTLNLNPIRKTSLKILYSPLAWSGQVRFMLKRYLYNHPVLMNAFYSFITRTK
jgi:hypothetical protein